MKKYLSFLTMALLAVVFYSCEDVPAPYEINNNGKKSDVIYRETFASSLGKWKNIVVSGTGGWKNDYSTACATGYDNTTKVTTPVTAYLVSPVVSLEDVDTAHVTYEYVLRYSKADVNQQVLIIDADTYASSADPNAVKWTVLNDAHPETADYKNFATIDVNVPEQFMGKKVVFAFFYNCPENGSTWEVKNFIVLKGEASDNPGPGPDPDGSLFSKAFETSLEPFANYTTSGAGEWINDYKTAKATGYDNATKVTTAGTYYLVSPEIDLAGVDSAYVDYDYILRYNKGDENQQLLITTSFDENKPTEGWNVLNNKHTEGTDWATFANTKVVIPAQYIGQKIRLAFYYNTNATSGSTWEVKSIAVREGTPGINPKPNPDGGGTADNPYTVAQLQALFDANTIPTGTVYTRGIVSEVQEVNTSYGNATYFISDDGTKNNQFEVYRGYALDGEKFSSADQLQVGDTVVVYGTAVLYYSTREYTTGSKLAYSSRLGSGGTPTPPTPPDPVEGKKLSEFKNGGFETWVDDKTPEQWISSTSASTKDALCRSDVAHTGNYSAKLNSASANKRLASMDLALEAGTYKYSFYAKSEGSDANIASGYVPVESGNKAGTYTYAKDADNNIIYTKVGASEWIKISGSFTLSSAQTVNVIIMNQAGKDGEGNKIPGGTVLIDDYTITKQ